jgi:hypothetical protein
LRSGLEDTAIGELSGASGIPCLSALAEISAALDSISRQFKDECALAIADFNRNCGDSQFGPWAHAISEIVLFSMIPVTKSMAQNR